MKHCDLIFIGKKINSIKKHTKPFYSYSRPPMRSSIINCNTLSCQIQHIRELFVLNGIDESITFHYYFYPNIPKTLKNINQIINTSLEWPAPKSIIPIKSGFLIILDKGVHKND